MALMRSRRGVLRFGVLLASPTLICAAFCPALAKPEDRQPGTSLAGQLLVAMPEMSDPRFHHAVILLAQHDEKGALGIVINHPVEEMPIAKLLVALGIDSKGSEGSVQVFAGGPVQPEVGFIVHSAEYRRAGTTNIDGRVALTTDPNVLRDIGHRQGPRQRLIAFGYAGWGAGQLEGELALGGWFTVPEEPRLVFDSDRDKLWDEAMRHRTISL
jgi:putative transcriptional regulator